jgi:hypothetical protein
MLRRLPRVVVVVELSHVRTGVRTPRRVPDRSRTHQQGRKIPAADQAAFLFFDAFNAGSE